MTISDVEYIDMDRRRSGGAVAGIAEILQVASRDALSGGDLMGWRDHVEVIDAWNAGLSWFINHEGGRWLYEVWLDYLRALRAAGYTGGSISEAYGDEGIEDGFGE